MSGLLFANRVVDPLGSMTGIGRYVKQLTLALAARSDALGSRWDLCAPGEAGNPDWLPPGVGYRRVPGPRRIVHTAWTAASIPRLELMVGEFDFVHALHPSYPIPTRRPAVLTLHDLMPIQHPEWYDADERWGFRRTLAVAGRRGWQVIANSEYVAAQVRKLGTIDPRRLTVIPIAVDEQFRVPVDESTVQDVCRSHGVEPGRYVVAVGNVSTRKNLGVLVHAVSLIQPGECQLVLAGRSHTGAATVEREIRRRGVADRVHITGFFSDAELPALLCGARALVHPSVDEGFGIPPLEAMSVGTPVIAARAGSLPEIVGDAGVLVEPTDAQAWADAITTMSYDSSERRRLADAGRARASFFTWDRTADATLDVYRRL